MKVYLSSQETVNTKLFLKGVYSPTLVLSHRTKLVPQLSETLRRRQQSVDDLFVDRKPRCLNHLLSNAVGETAGIGASVRSAKKYGTNRGSKYATKVSLTQLAALRPA